MLLDWLNSIRWAEGDVLQPGVLISNTSLCAVVEGAPTAFLLLAYELSRDACQQPYAGKWPTLVFQPQAVGQATPEMVPIAWLQVLDRCLAGVHWLGRDEEGQEIVASTGTVPRSIIQRLVEVYQNAEFHRETFAQLRSMVAGVGSDRCKEQGTLQSVHWVAKNRESERRQVATLATMVKQLLQLAKLQEDRVADKLLAIQHLAYGASHEFNNPLANMATRAQTLARDESDPNRRKTLQTINAQAFRGFDMLANLMHFAKPPQMDWQRFDVCQLTKTALADVTRFFSQPGAPTQNAIDFDVQEELPEVDGDPAQLLVAVKSVLRNAMETGGAVGLKVHESSMPDGKAAILWCVSDRGPGLPFQRWSQMFDPFFSGREAGRGLGFGLAVSYQVVRQHSGQLEVEQGDPTGLLIQLRIPVRRVSVDGRQQDDN